MLTADVAVVGGGPAGAAAAITLARAGRDVVVVDKAVFPRDKCCGDGLTTGALRRLEELGLRPADVASWQPVSDVVLRSPSGAAARFPLPHQHGTYAAVARRVELDAALLDAARAAGVKVYDGHALRALTVLHDRVALEVAGLGVLQARYVIAADGMWSPTRKLLGATSGAEPGYLGEWHAFRQYLSGSGTAAAASTLWVWFEPDLLPGYAWAFPLPGGTVNVGLGVRRRRGQRTGDLGARFTEVLTRPHIAEVLGAEVRPEGPAKAWPIPARIGKADLSAADGRVLFAGDAARATDPMTGEGIGQALETGMDAATAVLAAGPSRPHLAAHQYDRGVRRGMVLDHALASGLSRMLSSPTGARAAIALAASTPWTRRNFARWLFEDYPRAMLATPHRWHRRMLTGPGAYQPAQPRR